jgi:hypothetical protein
MTLPRKSLKLDLRLSHETPVAPVDPLERG